jgi:hypothetical protein
MMATPLTEEEDEEQVLCRSGKCKGPELDLAWVPQGTEGRSEASRGWECGPCGSMLAQHAQSPEFKPCLCRGGRGQREKRERKGREGSWGWITKSL